MAAKMKQLKGAYTRKYRVANISTINKLLQQEYKY